MGEYNVHCDTFDSLDYLIPPVKKSRGVHEQNLLYNRNLSRQSDIRNIKDFRKKKKISSPFHSHESDIQTSSSVILKQTTKELFHEQFSILNFRNHNFASDKCLRANEIRGKNRLIEDKPMIKVTVIPKAVESQATTKVFNKRCKRSYLLQSTVSNQENSITSRNIYFMVKGKRREKVYEIKASESTKLSNKICNTKYEDFSIQQISNSKRLISSLNMEKKRRKNKRRELDNTKDNNIAGICPNSNICHEHQGVRSPTSKVRIVGQLGLNQDDQYVLKCAATVNDKPITSNFVQIDNNNQSYVNNNKLKRNADTFTSMFKTTGLFQDNCNNYSSFRQQDSNVQTDICFANRCKNRNSYSEPRMNSQATQVDFNMSTYKSSKSYKNQVAQCNCDSILSTGTNANDIYVKNNALKDCRSPLVIISVYPRQDENKNSPVKIIQYPFFSEQTEKNNVEHNSKFRGKNGQIRNECISSVNNSGQKNFRSRSPSPDTKTSPMKSGINKFVAKTNRANIVSPQRQKNLNKSTPKLQNLKKDVSCYCPLPAAFKEPTHQESSKRDDTRKVREMKRNDTKQVKRALVNNFLKSVDRIDHMKAKTKVLVPKDDSSRVKINIDGEKERYDVLFEQRKFDTGVSVRKTLKTKSRTHSTEDEIDIISMENFLMLSDEIKDINDTAMHSRETSELAKKMPKESRLNIKDSLEICHSREGRAGPCDSPNNIKGTYDIPQSFYSSDFLAPVKHYRGDNCSIPDPNERDKEIRELLGIVRNKRNSKKDAPQDTKDKRTESHKEKGCCCSKKCSSKGLMTGLSFSRFLTSKCLKRKPKKQKVLNASTQSQKRVTEEKKDNAVHNPAKKHAIKSTRKLKNVDDEIKENGTEESFKKKITNSALRTKKICHATPKATKNKELIQESSDSPFNESSPTRNPKENVIIIKENTITRRDDSSTEENKRLDKEQRITGKKEDNNKEPVTTANVPYKEPVIEQNLILNRNIQVFLQVEQFTKQRPIILTRKQYDKVKKTIQCTISKNFNIEQRKRCNLKNCNVISVGEIKVKPKLQRQFRYDREVQTERSEIQRTVKCVQIQTHNRYKTQRTKMCTTKKHDTSEREINKVIYSFDSKDDMSTNNDVTEKHMKLNEIAARQTVSSMEIRYANVAYMKHLTISSTHFGDGFHNGNNINFNGSKKSNISIHTIFKGHKKSATPNLGTSAYSLYSDVTVANNSVKSIKAPLYTADSKPKKPLLQRLISCLVMRSAETSVPKDVLPARKIPSVNSSVDSYHISTSLGALEMSSTLYDTSASFYSNHTTQPHNKIKRGFFSSVRGFLTARRS